MTKKAILIIVIVVSGIVSVKMFFATMDAFFSPHEWLFFKLLAALLMSWFVFLICLFVVIEQWQKPTK